jgi:alkanesulfonate monooxygenase SsuD/methylene tetrahydromethanopterin reductase-like flavin-dependent oxidoreductase (luciferase family)
VTQLHLAVALDGAGWHPAAWRETDARPDELFSAPYWVDLARLAADGLADLVTIEDSLSPQRGVDGYSEPGTGQVQGRLDAVLVAARVAPVIPGLGFVPTVTATHTEPFHISKAVATLDYVSTGRAGVRVKVSALPLEAGHFGRREVDPALAAGPRAAQAQPAVTALMDEAADYVEVVRRLWDSWEDDAEIRDAATGRFVDREKLHYIDFEGRWFSVKGPSITPRPPQGQPLVAVLAHGTPAYRLAARSADVVFVTPADEAAVPGILAELQAERGAAERLRVLGDVVVFLDEEPGAARSRKDRLDETEGAAYTSDAHVFTGTASELADLIEAWQAAGLDGVRLRPGAVPHDLTAITAALVPELQRRGLFRTAYEPGSLRSRFGLSRPANRYAA